MTYVVRRGDCIETMGRMASESVDAIVTDPPYSLGFMGKAWDSTGVENDPETWRHALRLLKPGGHVLAFGGTRTYHRLTCAIEDAGFEIRDCLAWLYGSGFPKSLDVSKAIDKAAGAERQVVGVERSPFKVDAAEADRRAYGAYGAGIGEDGYRVSTRTAPATPEAERWEGWGTALKPAHEPIVLARKPFAGTVAENVQVRGTGALNVDSCRVGRTDGDRTEYGRDRPLPARGSVALGDFAEVAPYHPDSGGRWPANLILDPEAAGLLDEQVPDVSRFFYCPKAGRAERNAGLGGADAKPLNWSSGEQAPGTFQSDGTQRTAQNHHPTVKPIALMRWLCRLVTPPDGTILDPFSGSGTTGCAAAIEGFDYIGLEREAEYVDIAEARIAYWSDPAEGKRRVAELEREIERDRADAAGEPVQLGLLDEAA